jgi:hypothetical protein
MSLKTNAAQTPAPPAVTPEKTSPVVHHVQPADYVTLELALYTQYHYQGKTFQKGTAYKFRRDVAMQLLGEHDHSRPVWRIYRAPAPKVKPKHTVEEAMTVEFKKLEEMPNGSDSKPTRIDVGTDDEIAEILSNVADEPENVTV